MKQGRIVAFPKIAARQAARASLRRCAIFLAVSALISAFALALALLGGVSSDRSVRVFVALISALMLLISATLLLAVRRGADVDQRGRVRPFPGRDFCRCAAEEEREKTIRLGDDTKGSGVV